MGGDGGDVRALTDFPIIVPSRDTQHVQEVHIVVIHLLCELVELGIMATDHAVLPPPLNTMSPPTGRLFRRRSTDLATSFARPADAVALTGNHQI